MTRYALLAAGSNSHGQLATDSRDDAHSFLPISLPSSSYRPLQLACGANHSLLLVQDVNTATSCLLVAGSNQKNQLHPASDQPFRLDFDQLRLNDLLRPLPNLQAGAFELAGVAACWETSFIHLRPVDKEGTGSDILLSMGANDWGERGTGSVGAFTIQEEASIVDFDHLASPGETIRIKRIEAGPRHVLALLSLSFSPLPSSATSSFAPAVAHKFLVGWGASRHGQLGPSASSSSPPRVTPRPEVILLPPGYTSEDVLDFAVGKEHSAILFGSKSGEESKVLVLGAGRHGQLGPFESEEPYSSNAFIQHSETAPQPSRKVKDKQPARSSNLLSASSLVSSLACPPLPSSATDVSIQGVGCAWNGTYVLLSASSSTASSPLPSGDDLLSSPQNFLVAFGSDQHGQLGSPLPAAHVSTSNTQPAETPTTPCPPPPLGQPRLVHLPSSASSTRTSSLTHTPLDPSTNSSSICKLACGSEHLLTILDDRCLPPRGGEEAGSGSREVWGWGWNEHGNLSASSSSASRLSRSSLPVSADTPEAGGGPKEEGGLDDVVVPRRVWPCPLLEGGRIVTDDKCQKGARGRVVDVWAGMATSWILVEEEEEEGGEGDGP
ncbi:hypothetical protein JCM11641_003010 [Rhodosporidiobolus odoratus]